MVGDRKRGCVIRDRQADRNLTVVLLAQLAAILARYAHRVLALLGKAGVVDDPRPDRSMLFDLWKDPVANPRQQGRVRPRRLSHEMQQRLMPGRHPRRRQRFHALALQRHQKSEAVILQRLSSVGVTNHPDQGIDIGVECRFTLRRPVGHGALP